MDKNLLDLFSERLFKEFSDRKIGLKDLRDNASLGNLVVCPESESIPIYSEFIKEKLADFQNSLYRHDKSILRLVMDGLLVDHSDLVFSQLSLLPVRERSDQKCYDKNILNFYFNEESMVTYLKNYNDSNFLYSSHYSFIQEITRLATEFKYRKDFEQIILNAFNLNSVLIRKCNGNLIATRSWCIKNIENINLFEHFYRFDYDKPLFFNMPIKTSLMHIDVRTVQQFFVLKEGKDYIEYKKLINLFVYVLNEKSVKNEIAIDSAEGLFIMKNKVYQLSLFHKNDLDTPHIENIITLLLKAVCFCMNESPLNIVPSVKKILDVYQYHLLDYKLPASGKRISIKSMKI